MNDKDKLIFLTRNRLMYYPIEKVINLALNRNIIISNLAIEELIKRNPTDFDFDLNTLSMIIKKMSIEQIYALGSSKSSTPLANIAHQELEKILTFYENNIDFYRKCNEGNENNFKLIKNI